VPGGSSCSEACAFARCGSGFCLHSFASIHVRGYRCRLQCHATHLVAMHDLRFSIKLRVEIQDCSFVVSWLLPNLFFMHHRSAHSSHYFSACTPPFDWIVGSQLRNGTVHGSLLRQWYDLFGDAWHSSCFLGNELRLWCGIGPLQSYLYQIVCDCFRFSMKDFLGRPLQKQRKSATRKARIHMGAAITCIGASIASRSAF